MAKKQEAEVDVRDVFGHVVTVVESRAKALVDRGTHTYVTDEPEPDDLTEVVDPDDGPTGDEYDDASYAELQAECKARELPATGSAEEIRARLREDDAKQQ